MRNDVFASTETLDATNHLYRVFSNVWSSERSRAFGTTHSGLAFIVHFNFAHIIHTPFSGYFSRWFWVTRLPRWIPFPLISRLSKTDVFGTGPNSLVLDTLIPSVPQTLTTFLSCSSNLRRHTAFDPVGAVLTFSMFKPSKSS